VHNRTPRTSTLLGPSLMAGMVLLTSVQNAFAQACADTSGTWQDTAGGLWVLAQSPNQSIAGGYVVGGTGGSCPSSIAPRYQLSGSYTGNGQFKVTGTATTTVTGCATSISASGQLKQPGCNNASITWSNSSGGFGVQAWSAACTLPSGEATPVFAGWSDETVGQWNTALLPLSYNFGGRTVTETAGGVGSDLCEFSGSAVKPYTQISGGTWTIPDDGTNVYGPDLVGRAGIQVWYYRAHGRAPCTSTIYQTMIIACSSGSPSYITNTLTYTVGYTTVTSTRAAAQETETWIATPQQINSYSQIFYFLCFFGNCSP
jgi:hypothetical protein